MTPPHDSTRRAVMTALASLPLSSSAATSSSGGEMRQLGSPTLVAYFSRSGNPGRRWPDPPCARYRFVRDSAGHGLSRRLSGHRQAGESGARPRVRTHLGDQSPQHSRLRHRVSGLSNLGGDRAASDPQLSKGARPFRQDRDSLRHPWWLWAGEQRSVLASHAPKALLREGFSMQADQERQTMDKVTGWLKKRME